MSTLGDAFRALRQVVLIDANVDRLEKQVVRLSDDVDGLTDTLGELRDRVSRLEGFIDGVRAASAGTQPQSRIEG